MAVPVAPTWFALVLSGLTALGSGYVYLTADNRDRDQRLSKLEAFREEESKKTDHIQTQVDKLVEWALGKK